MPCAQPWAPVELDTVKLIARGGSKCTVCLLCRGSACRAEEQRERGAWPLPFMAAQEPRALQAIILKKLFIALQKFMPL